MPHVLARGTRVLFAFHTIDDDDNGELPLHSVQGEHEGLAERVHQYLLDVNEQFLHVGGGLALMGAAAACMGTGTGACREEAGGDSTTVEKDGKPSGGKRSFTIGSGAGAIGGALLFAWIFYVVVFHCLANLPLSSPMPREVCFSMSVIV